MIVDKKKTLEFIKRFELIDLTFSQNGEEIISKYRITSRTVEEYTFIRCTKNQIIKSVENSETNEEITMNLLVQKVLSSIVENDEVGVLDITIDMNIRLRLLNEREIRKYVIKQMVMLLKDHITIKITKQHFNEDALYIYCDYKMFNNTYELKIEKSFDYTRLFEEKNIIKEEENKSFAKMLKKIAIEKNSCLKVLDANLFVDEFRLSDIIKVTVLTEFKKTPYYKLRCLYEPDFKKILL